MRTAFFVDGYNLFYGLLAGTDYKWLDLPGLLAHVAHVQDPASHLVSVDYFTSGVKPELATRGIQSKEAQDTYVRALKAKGVQVHYGRHQLDPAKAPRFIDKQTRPSRQDKVDIWKLEEKETDVHIAVSIYRLAARQTSQAEYDRNYCDRYYFGFISNLSSNSSRPVCLSDCSSR